MSTVQTPRILNKLLASLSVRDLERLLPYLEPVDLPARFVIAAPDRLGDYVYFLDSGIGSVVVIGANGRSAEVALFGLEGMAPTATLQGAVSAPYSIFMQVAGTGHRIQSVFLLAAAADSIEMRNFFTRYVQASSVQTAYTAFSNASADIEQRLARWLLMCHDRTIGDLINLTHEFLSVMLAVRRQSVTTTLHVLEGKHLIVSERKAVTVRDRKGLELLAGGFYGVPEREYQKLVTTL